MRLVRRVVSSAVFAAILISPTTSFAAPTKSAPNGAKVAEARKALDDKLLDYGSTRLRGVRLVSTSANFDAFCGEINTKNRMGGYLGWKKFMIPLGDTPLGNVLDKITIEGQPNSMLAIMSQHGAGPGAGLDANLRLISRYCGEGKPVDKLDYAAALTSAG